MYTEKEERQFELFDDYAAPQPAEGRVYKKLFDSERRAINLAYEQMIFLSCVIILSLVVTFSLGIERGRHIGLARNTAQVSAQKKPIPLQGDVAAPSAPENKKAGPPLLKFHKAMDTETSVIADGSYIIQLVSYKKENFAREELERLKVKGMNPFIKRSGDYYLVYMAYNTRQDADNSVKALKRRYKDCFVKKAK